MNKLQAYLIYQSSRDAREKSEVKRLMFVAQMIPEYADNLLLDWLDTLPKGGYRERMREGLGL